MTYSLSPEPPDGLTFDGATRTLSGTPTTQQEAVTYTYTVTDSDATNPDSASLTFTITVNEPDLLPSFGDATIEDKTYIRGVAITDVTLPEATGGNGELTYSVSPELPAGLSFDTMTRVMSGTPTAEQEATDFTYTVTDSDESDPDSASLTFTITVNEPDLSPSFDPAATIANKTYIVGMTIATETLPEATGGNGELTYSILPNLPMGLSFDAASRELSGTPTELQEATEYTYSVTDSDETEPDSVSLTFTITVVPPDTAPSFGSATIADKTYTRGTAITDETFPAATGGDGALTYNLNPDPPEGLNFDRTTRTLSGTPTTQQEAVTYTYTVTDSDAINPDSASLTFTITVNEPDLVPSFGDATIENKTYIRGTAITAETLPVATGGDGALTYNLSPDPPEGLTFDTTTRVLSGTPTAQQAATEFTYTVTDSDESDPDSASLSFTITVNEQGTDGNGENPEGYAILFGFLNLRSNADAITVNAVLQNVGTRASSATTGYVEAISLLDESAMPIRAMPNQVDIGALEPDGVPWVGSFTLPLSSLSSSESYDVVLFAHRTAEEPEDAWELRAFGDVHIKADGQVRVTCEGFDRDNNAGTGDPLLDDQWGLRNTGQTAHAMNGGIAGEDLRMRETLENGPTGRGVTVAIVDSGLEICHPDLAANVEEGMSYNFVADKWHGAKRDDPFLPSLQEGDHGTSVAGITTMVANNGIGGRGVAPEAGLRGFNVLALDAYLLFEESGEDDFSVRELDALGMSTSNPPSSDVDIFNMSYGVELTEGALKLSADKHNALKAGVEKLRVSDETATPLGALYVLASGNNFDECQTATPLSGENQDGVPISSLIGCVSANLDPESAWPYVIHTGAFNADGKRSSYSSVASSVWIVAPGGEDGIAKPAVLTTDQMGIDRGYAGQFELDELGTTDKNPLGDYTHGFGGTSSAAPFAAGATAVLLSAQPELTWRDVKHVFAKTARQLDADIRPAIAKFGGKTATLQHSWITNAADYTFHNHYGFGAIDVDAAVGFARSMTPNNLGVFTQSEPFTQTASMAIPDHDGEGVTLTQSINGLPTSANIEAVQVRFEITHPKPYELGLTLTSPGRTPSVINPVFNEVLTYSTTETLDWEVLSNAFYGESPNGNWQLNVIDAASENTGQVKSWSLVFFYGEHPEN